MTAEEFELEQLRMFRRNVEEALPWVRKVAAEADTAEAFREGLRREHAGCERATQEAYDHEAAQRAMVLSIIGGEVEGLPTGPHNYLQRLRELVAIEQQRDELLDLLRDARADLVSLVVMLRNEITGNLDEGLRTLNCGALVARVAAIDDWFGAAKLEVDGD